MRERLFIIPQNSQPIAAKSPKPLPRGVRDRFSTVIHLNPAARRLLLPFSFQPIFPHPTPRATSQKIERDLLIALQFYIKSLKKRYRHFSQSPRQLSSELWVHQFRVKAFSPSSHLHKTHTSKLQTPLRPLSTPIALL
ncbi:MAG: hypothetical protein SW833_07775 [Cyanobacteriota bacterium]|nr:hypothetical protein [Cyanobacteriota bacterium]